MSGFNMNVFEKWLNSRPLYDPGELNEGDLEAAWLASRKAALEEAAKVCEEYIAAADSAVRPLVALGCPAVILALIDRP